ncbi:MAG TPA: protein archease [Desulfuromonas sp.]|nr:protein archease [Desulfuromonas sp.]
MNPHHAYFWKESESTPSSIIAAAGFATEAAATIAAPFTAHPRAAIVEDMAPFRLFEHTADIGIDADGASLAELFHAAADGLLQLLGGEPAANLTESRTVTLFASDGEELLVSWLNEILFLLETRRFLPGAVRILEASPTRLVAELRGESLDPKRHSFARMAKAATYHNLQLVESEGRWSARIFIDL